MADFKLSNLTWPITKHGRGLDLTYPMQCRLLKHLSSREPVRLSEDITFMMRMSPCEYVFYRNGKHSVTLTIAQMHELIKNLTVLDWCLFGFMKPNRICAS